MFQCECGERFSVKLWHCSMCNHHWPPSLKACKNCYTKRGSKSQPDPPPTRKPQPTKAPPGTKAKLDAMIARAAAGEELFSKDDTQLQSHEQGKWEFLGPTGCVTNTQGAPRVFRDIPGMGGGE